MNEAKLRKVFESIKNELQLDYAIIDVEDLGETHTSVNCMLTAMYGVNSKGIWLKHWESGLNEEAKLSKLTEVLIAHDLTEEQGIKVIQMFKDNGYELENDKYIKNKCMCIQKPKLQDNEKYKLRIYYSEGKNKGEVKKEETFSTMEDAHNRYIELSKCIKNSAYRPTLWIWKKDVSNWIRDENY